MGKYNFSASRRNKLNGLNEEMQVVGCDSFDEARKIVERAIYDREMFESAELEKRKPQQGAALARHPQQDAPSGAVTTNPQNVPSGNNG